MAPQSHVDFVVLRLAYADKLSLKRPTMKYRKRQSKPEIEIPQVREWFDNAMRHELYKLPAGMKSHYVEWRVVSNNTHSFCINGIRYDQIIIIMGEYKVWWSFHTNFPPLQFVTGNGNFTISYCSCCLNKQYMRIVAQVFELHYKTLVTKVNSNSRRLHS